MISACLLLAGCAPAIRHFPAERALGPYSGAVAARGLIFISGKIGDPAADFATQTGAALDAVEGELRRAGTGWSRVLSVTVYLAEMERYGEFNEIYRRRIPAPFPARAVVGVKDLPAGAAVELQVIAAAD